jgi:hypothetical protein
MVSERAFQRAFFGVSVLLFSANRNNDMIKTDLNNDRAVSLNELLEAHA